MDTPAAAGRVLMVVCAWCTATMSPGTLPASHGICPTCIQAVADSEAADDAYARYLADRMFDPRD